MGEIIVWGEPHITLFGQQVDFNAQTSLRCEDSDIKEGGLIFSLPDNIPTISFDVEIDESYYKTIRNLYKRRMPRKFKKEVKYYTSKYLGIKMSKIRFDMSVFNNKRRYGRKK